MRSLMRLSLPLLIVFGGLIVLGRYANAEGTSRVTSCEVFVRLIKAIKSSPNSPVSAKKINAKLADVREQLAPLPFEDYETVDARTARVALSEKATFHLRHASQGVHTVRVEPHEVSGGRVHLTVDWEDAQGESLVSTMVRVVDGQNVMLGAEGKTDACSLVGVRVSCGSKK